MDKARICNTCTQDPEKKDKYCTLVDVSMYFQAVLSQEKLPSLDGVLIGGKSLQYSKAVFSFQQLICL